ncbi:murein DD-endopeptidase MepM [Acerihabitans sp. TG2]|uniref:murein DD-endopeptidase MepM n=1 Tax=Acerihabitans sp. TG2 TaxID=3096008 RepID=UPI002B221DA2|nr:murein DD-endopeptidase MepM [Acerihabitans sp. TG2]MEA9392976.1 murein DD-endopeptidase MepM [Acerihabitans sp. TG2]
MQQVLRSLTLAYYSLPRPHRVLLGSLTVVTLAVAVWRPYVHSPVMDPVARRSITLSNKPVRELAPEASGTLDSSAAVNDDEVPPEDDLDEKIAGEKGVHEYVVSSGDTLGSILTQYGIEMSDVSELAQQFPQLRNIKIGQQISWTLSDAGELQQLTWEISRRETRTYDRVGNGFKESIANQVGEWKNITLDGDISGSFAASARKAGLSTAEVSAVIKAMQWQLDFRKLKKGDQFSVLTSREMLAGHREQSELLGVRLSTGGHDYYSFRADDGKYYNRDGAGLARGFLRFPTMKHYRISSSFNPRRLNPVTGRISPHRGVDFAMPVGTPVLAVGDGEVMVSKNGHGAGNYVAIRHGRQYMTRYMHLSKLLVKPGQKVKRGDRIALSGNTGRSTGPHLHYEIWINQQAVNPLTAQLPRTEGLMGRDRLDYLAQVRTMMPQLAFTN